MSQSTRAADSDRATRPGYSMNAGASAGWPQWARPLRPYRLSALVAFGLHAGFFFWSGWGKNHRVESVGALAGSSGPSAVEVSFYSADLDEEEADEAEEIPEDANSLPELPSTQLLPSDFLVAVEFEPPKIRLDRQTFGISPVPLPGVRLNMGQGVGRGIGEMIGQGVAHTTLDGRMIATAMPPPRYPESARRDRREGKVELYVTIAANGHAARVEVLKTSGSRDLDAAARKVVFEQWRFQPPTDAATRECVVRVAFRLNQPELAMGGTG